MHISKLYHIKTLTYFLVGISAVEYLAGRAESAREATVQPTAVRVDGTLNERSYASFSGSLPGDPTGGKQRNVSFTAWLATSHPKSWKFRIEYQNPIPFTQRIGTDGKNIYVTTDHDTTKRPNTFSKTVTIKPDATPFRRDKKSGYQLGAIPTLCWFSFASRGSLGEKPGRLRSPFLNHSSPLRKTSISFLRDSNSLPKSIMFELDKIELAYKTHSSTNVNGIKIPTSAKWVRFNGGEPAVAYDMQLKSVRKERQIRSYVPPFPEDAESVNDHRFSAASVGLNRLKYAVEEPRWLPKTNAYIQRRWEEKLRRAGFYDKRNSNRRLKVAVTLSVLCLIVAFPVMLVMYRKKRGTIKTRN